MRLGLGSEASWPKNPLGQRTRIRAKWENGVGFQHREVVDGLRSALGQVIRGKPEAVELLLTGLLAQGHILLEDVPGVGKTTLAKALAKVFSIEFARVQFTPDLLPADILGSELLNPQDGSFRFRRGPIFTHVLLADEINRASPRTQSALLEAMNESQITIEGKTHPLQEPFCVIATQNPVDFQGTYPLPEAQLDRFMLRFGVGYPDPSEEMEILYAHRSGSPLDSVHAIATAEDLLRLQQIVREIEVAREVAGYLLRIVDATRRESSLELGISTRGTLACFRAAQARAFLSERTYVSPHDIQSLAIPVLAHRVQLASEARYAGKSARTIVSEIVSGVDVPL